jgi:5-formyltetrahydrofolate cyclo-ligase
MGILEPTEFLGDGVTPRPNLEKDWATSGSNPRPPLDALLIPGLAFDRTGNRCGRGGGYYDAFISRYFEKCEQEFGLQPPPLVALAYSAQVLPPGDVPMAAYDRKVDAIATKDGVLACTPLGEKVSSGSGWMGPGLGWDAR